jgi:MYXO-CTERM domain-containing protein
MALVLSFGATSASADSFFYFQLGTGNSAINGYTGPYANVTVDLAPTGIATITFNSLTVGGNAFLMGAQGAVAVNVNASSWTVGSITGTNSGTGFSPGPLTDGGSGTEDGFGSFNQTINSFDSFTHSSDSISFTLTNTGGTWTDASQVLVDNPDSSVAAHILVTSAPANAANSAVATGYATDSNLGQPTPFTPSVPEPSTLAIAGLGALGLVGSGLRRRRVK